MRQHQESMYTAGPPPRQFIAYLVSPLGAIHALGKGPHSWCKELIDFAKWKDPVKETWKARIYPAEVDIATLVERKELP